MDRTFQEVDVSTLAEWLQQERVALIDVRELLEYKAGYIPSAQLFPLTTFDPKKILNFEGKEIVFYCARGNRSARAAQQWFEWSKKECSSLKGGIHAWREAKFPVEVDQ